MEAVHCSTGPSALLPSSPSCLSIATLSLPFWWPDVEQSAGKLTVYIRWRIQSESWMAKGRYCIVCWCSPPKNKGQEQKLQDTVRRARKTHAKDVISNLFRRWVINCDGEASMNMREPPCLSESHCLIFLASLELVAILQMHFEHSEQALWFSCSEEDFQRGACLLDGLSHPCWYPRGPNSDSCKVFLLLPWRKRLQAWAELLLTGGEGRAAVGLPRTATRTQTVLGCLLDRYACPRPDCVRILVAP